MVPGMSPVVFAALLGVAPGVATPAATRAPFASGLVLHDAQVTLQPAEGRIEIEDTLTLPEGCQAPVLRLHEGLEPQIDGGTVSEQRRVDGFDVVSVSVSPAEGRPARITVRARGRIVHPPQQVATEHQRSFQESIGTIEARGVYLAPETGFLPAVDCGDGQRLVAGRLSVNGLPAGWSALSEGTQKKGGSNVWVEHAPIEGFHLVAGPFVKSAQKKGDVDVQVWLRVRDDALAARYIEVTGQYLALYRDLLGPYPYGKFALVENFWETGYGMPSFTLLGPQVIRFPFILHTSYPHELLHNYWGNGVFVIGGNWSEGLTAYLADHLHAEQQGTGDEYRRTALQRYQDFVEVSADKDFPLSAFVGRFSAASEAVGYGKMMMLAHMLRIHLGDERFSAALQRFWRHHQGRRASLEDLEATFSAVANEDLGPWFSAWTTRPGAPRLRVREVREEVDGAGRVRLSLHIEQAQAADPFFMDVPFAVTTVDGRTVTSKVELRGRVGQASLALPARVNRVDVDPFFDTFRSLDPAEVPPAFSRALGAKKMLFVLPTLASTEEREAWRAFSKSLCGSEVACTVVDDRAVGTLPADAAVWVLGYGNELRAGGFVPAQLAGARFDDRGFLPPGAWQRVQKAKDKKAALLQHRADPGKVALAVAVEHPRNRALALAFVGSPSASVVSLLAKKIPHYGKYGWLGFAGDQAENALKGTWSASSSPLTTVLQPQPLPRVLKAAPALASLPPPFDSSRMMGVVKKLADKRMGGRATGSPGLARARTVVVEGLQTAGFAPEVACEDVSLNQQPTSKVQVCAVQASLVGTDPSLPPVVLGAHLDHLGTPSADARAGEAGKMHPGADDNASGVAVLLEVARDLKARGPGLRSIHFLIFEGEELGLIGSRAWLKRRDNRAPLPFAMINLDTVGRLQGRKLLILNGDSASEWVHIFRGVGFTTGVQSELANEGGGASDQQAFLDEGVPAVQLFAGPTPDYHRSSDTADKVEPHSLVDVAVVAREALVYLADRKEPLTLKLAKATTAPTPAATGPRRAAVGIVPDMTYPGPGVRVEDVQPGSPAQKAGLDKGDIIVGFGGSVVVDLRGYSELLKAREPGETVEVAAERNGESKTFKVLLGSR